MEQPAKYIDKYTKIWRELGFYERFEQVVAIFLSILISIIIFFACFQIAILAMVRKFILIDLAKTEAMVLIGLAAIVTALAALHWAVKHSESKGVLPLGRGREAKDD